MNLQSFQIKLLDFLSEDPNTSALYGLDKNLGELPDPGKNARIKKQGKLKMLKHALGLIDTQNFTRDEAIDYRLCELTLESQRLYYELEIDGAPQNMRMPRATEHITDPIFLFFTNDPREVKYRIVNILSRLEKVDQYLTSYKKNIIGPVKRWVHIEIEQIDGTPDFFNNILAWAKDNKFKNILRLESAIAKANTAFASYKEFLKNIDKTDNIFLGHEQLSLILKSRGIEQNTKQLHQIATEFTAKNHSEVSKLQQKLIKKYSLDSTTSVHELQNFLNKKYQVKREGTDFSYILKRYKSEKKQILDFIEEHDLFPIVENEDMSFIQTPGFLVPTIPAGAMMPPLPFREGKKTSLIYLTINEELLQEHTEISIPSMMIHEGIPGHHLQYAWGTTHNSPIRKIFNANDLSEGWATMLEDYIFEKGYKSELADEIRFSNKRDIARIGARVAIDLYFMSGEKKFLKIGVDCDLSSNDPFEAATHLLKAVTGFSDARAAAEINWYSQERGYPLSYLTGNHLVWALKNKFTQQSTKISSSDELSEDSRNKIEREFHKRLLTAGNMPVSLLEKFFCD